MKTNSRCHAAILSLTALLSLGRTLPAQTPPSIAITGIYNLADMTTPVTFMAPQALQAIVGTNLAKQTAAYENTNPGTLPTNLAGTTVTVGGQPMPLTFVSPGLIIFMSQGISGGGYLQVVSNGAVSNQVLISMNFVTAEFMTTVAAGNPVPVLLGPDGRAVGTQLRPIVVDGNPRSQAITALVNGGVYYEYNPPTSANEAPIGPVPPGLIAAGFCVSDQLPQVVITNPQGEKQILDYVMVADSTGVTHPGCQQLGFYALLTLQLPKSEAPADKSGWTIAVSSTMAPGTGKAYAIY